MSVRPAPKYHDPEPFIKAREQRIGIVTVLVAGVLSSNPQYVSACDDDRKRIIKQVSKWADSILESV